MFNSKRLEVLERRQENLEKDMAKVTLALMDCRGYHSMFGNTKLRQMGDIDTRIDRLMRHLGLSEETIHEHTIITKGKK